MDRDLPNENKKCRKGTGDRIFRLNLSDANEKNCRERCGKHPQCVAMSGIWGNWCIGCKVALSEDHMGAKAFKRGKKTCTYNIEYIRKIE